MSCLAHKSNTACATGIFAKQYCRHICLFTANKTQHQRPPPRSTGHQLSTYDDSFKFFHSKVSRRRMMQHQVHRPQRILIVGGGPAGSTTAFFLARAGFQVDVAEASTTPPYGQGIDITDEAIPVVEQMGMMDLIKSNTTGEAGFALLDDDAREIGTLGTSKEGGISPTQEIEIMRGTLVEILSKAATEKGVRFRYGCTVSSIDEKGDAVSVVLSDTNKAEEYSAIIGADGIFSQVRRLGFPDVEQPYIYTDTYCAYFSMTADADSKTPYSRLQNATKGRAIWMRPVDASGSRVSCYFIATSPRNTGLQEISKLGTSSEKRKAFLEGLFRDVQGLKSQAVRGMHESTDFYFTRIMQVKLDKWHHGRCALVGDAAYCPSPISGQGTTLALAGAYVLAGELAASPADPAKAFSEYQRKLKRLVKEEGNIPLGGYAPRLVQPQSALGIWTLRSMFWAISRVDIAKVMAYLPNFGGSADESGKKSRIPRYTF